MATPEFHEGQFIRYIVEGPIVALVVTPDGMGVVLKIGGAEGIVLSGRQLDLIQQGPDPRDAEIDRLRKLTETCTCGTPGVDYEGPQADCSVHGAIRGFAEASAELERLRARAGELETQREQLARALGVDLSALEDGSWRDR